MTDVSVVVPTRDRAALLGATLRAALRSADVDLEIVVVDDGSADGTAGLLGGLADPRVRVLRHDAPRGVAAARNAGLGAARGRWVALLDDDDLWAPDKLSRQLQAATTAGAPWAMCAAVEVTADGRVTGATPTPSPDGLAEALRRRNVVPAGSSNVLVERALLQRVGGFDPALRHLADWDAWLRLAAAARPAVVADALVAYRQHDGQATLDTSGMTREARLLAERHGVDVGGVHRWVAWSHLRSGRRGAAVRACLAGVRAGDLGSLGRAVAAGLLPDPMRLRGRLHRPPPELARLARDAERWVADALRDEPPAAPDGRR